MINRFLLVLLVGIIFSHEIRDNTLLFCLNKNEPLLDLNSNGELNRGSHNEINNFLSSRSNSYIIEPWLSAATDNDYNGEIYLNRIYRISFNDLNRFSLNLIKNELSNLSSVLRVENEYIRKPYYAPNDVRYNQQWFLTQVQADHAWDFWDISNNQPGSKDVLLASVDTGVDWNHTDLVNNIWQNLGEDADGDGRTIEGSGSNWYLDPGDLNGIDDDDWDNNSSTYIDDLISNLTGLIYLKKKNISYKIINISSGKKIKILNLVRILEKNLNKKAKIKMEKKIPTDIPASLSYSRELKKLLKVNFI